MSDWELLDACEHTGLRKFMRYEEETDEVQIDYRQDVAPLIDKNKASQVDGFDKRSEFWHAAHIPTIVMYQWITKHGVNAWNPAHRDGVKRLLNDPEYRYLRVNNFIL